ncbi:hypothetical protein D3C72_901180 [compost metagenome]
MVGCAVAGRAHVQACGFALGIGDQFRHALGLDLGIDDQDVGYAGEQRDGGEVLVGVEWQPLVEGRVDAQGAFGGEQQRVPIGGRLGNEVRADVAAGAGSIVRYDLLAKFLRKARGQHTAQVVGAASHGEWDDQANRLRRVVIRDRDG